MGRKMQAQAEYLTIDELAARWKGVVHKGTLANWRAATPVRGPAFVKIGTKVLYPLEKVVQWEQQNMNDNHQGGGRGK